MRNLKRVLSLALALVMILGMMVMGASAASADFSDAAEINYTEAVDVLAGLGILEGYDDGSFQPDTILTRAQAAKIITFVVMGPENAAKVNKNTTIFVDVPATHWASGYIRYCSTLGFLDGVGDGRFDPEGTLTGVQFAKLLLTASGYKSANEGYVGADWATNIAADAISNGIDVPGVLLGDPVTREVASQMLLNAFDVETVYYTTGNVIGAVGPYAAEETFAEKYFPDLEKFEGVLTANEYANLDGAKVLKAGKSVIGETTYDYSSDVTMIGLAYEGWANDGEVIYIVESEDNTVWENAGAKTDISTSAKFKKVTGMTDAAEDFVNFDTYDVITYKTDILITYSLTGLSDDAVAIKAGKTLSEEDYDNIWSIFYDDEYAEGWVIVGTKVNEDDDKNAENDISDEISFKKFVAEYLEAPKTTNYYDVDACENGEWLKVIDNDGDGKADYVFVMWFEMTQVKSVKTDKKGVTTWTLYEEQGTLTFTDDAEDYTVVADEVSANSIVIWTGVEDVVYIKAAEKVTETIDKKGINSKAKTVTCGDNVYGQSGIYHYDAMACDLMDADTEVSYDFYLDFFGFVRLYQESAWGKGFVLLTDGYYETDKRDVETYKAEIWDVEEEDYADVTVLNGKTNKATVFINNDDSTGEKDWDRLYTAEEVYGVESDFNTNIAAFSKNDDDEYTLVKIDGKETASNRVAYYVEELAIDEDVDVDDKTLYEIDGETVQATTDTQYYLVVTTSKGKQVITSWTGYKNAPEGAALGELTVAYAVVHASKTADYDIADVIVFETDEYDPSDLYLVYDYNNYNSFTIGLEDDEYVSGLLVDMDTKKAAEIARKLTAGVADYYVITASGDAVAIDTDEDIKGEYAAEGIYAGTVVNDDDVDTRDYLKIAREGAKTLYFYEGDAPIFAITKTNNKISVDEIEYQDVMYLDNLVVKTDAKGNIEYLIDVDVDGDATGDLWDDIWVDAQDPVETYTITVKNYAENVVYELDVEGEEVVAGTYELTVEAAVGYENPVVYVGDDEAELEGDNGVYEIEVVDADVVVEIHGAATAIVYDITYTTDYAAVGSNAPDSYTIEDDVTLPELSYEGYTFGGWDIGEAVVEGWEAGDMIGNVEAEAVWTENVYDVTVYYVCGDDYIEATQYFYDVDYTDLEDQGTSVEIEGYELKNNQPVVVVDDDELTATVTYTYDKVQGPHQGGGRN